MKKRENKKEKRMRREKAVIAVAQVVILVIAIVAFTWMIGSEFKMVRASTTPCEDGGGTCVLSSACPTSTNTQTSANTGCTSPNICCTPKTTTTDTNTENDNNVLNKFIQGAEPLAINGVIELVKKPASKLAKSLFSPKVTPTASGENAIARAAAQSQNAANTVTNNAATKPDTFWDKVFGSSGGKAAQILRNAGWALVTYIVINYFARKYASVRNAQDIQTASLIGGGVGMVFASAFAGAGPPGWAAAAIMVQFVGLYMLFGYQDYSREIFTFRNQLWQPSVVADCNACNRLTIGSGDNRVSGCSAYTCHTYGTACEWVNDNTDYETCIEVNKGDVSAPVITPVKNIYGEDVFPNNKYGYQTTGASYTKIFYTGDGAGVGRCIPPFTSILLAFKTNENAECKIIYKEATGEESSTPLTTQEIFDNMQSMQEGNAYTINHTLNIPSIASASSSALEGAGYTLTNKGIYNFLIRCEDVRQNINSVDYQMSFCVQQGPDMYPPEIIGTKPAQNEFIAYGTKIINGFQVYTNEPADCKWDTQKGKTYDTMSYTMENCSQNINDALVGFNFGCEADLSGFQDGKDNRYYVACIDQPELKGQADKENKRNKGAAYEVVLKGTNQLKIEDVTINEKPNRSTIVSPDASTHVILNIVTSGGAVDGNSRCSYTETPENANSYLLFENNMNPNFVNPNTEDLYMPAGSYQLFLRCTDEADNYATTMINFTVKTDTSPPAAIRVYRDESDNTLILMTDEDAECVYSTNEGDDCNYNFDEGTEMNNDGEVHSVSWDPDSNFYIKCMDQFGHTPGSGICTIIAKPFEILKAQQQQ